MLLSLLLLAMPLARAQDSDTVTLNFVNADIDAVVKAVAEITGRNFILDPEGQGNGQHRFGAAGAEEPRLSDAAVRAAAARHSRRSKATASSRSSLEADAQAAGRSGDARGAVGADGDRLVTQVVTLRNESARSSSTCCVRSFTPNNAIAAFPSANALVITDYADNLRRIERIIASLDQPPAGRAARS